MQFQNILILNLPPKNLRKTTQTAKNTWKWSPLPANFNHKANQNPLGTQLYAALLSFHAVLMKATPWPAQKLAEKHPNRYSSYILALLPADFDLKANEKNRQVTASGTLIILCSSKKNHSLSCTKTWEKWPECVKKILEIPKHFS